MHLKIWAKDTNPWLAAGAGLYWASYAFRIMNPDPVYSSALGAGSCVIEDVFMTLWVFVTYLACRRWGVRRPRRALAGVMVGCAALVFACEASSAQLPWGAAFALSCADLFTLGASMILWGLAFASLEKHLAARNVVVAVLFSAAVILLGKAASAAVPLSWLMCASSAAGSLIMLSGRVSLTDHRRAPKPRPARGILPLALQRVGFGFSLGLFPTATAALAGEGCDYLLLAFAVCVIVMSAVAALRSDEPPCTMLPALVLVACGTLCLPFLDGGLPLLFPSLFCGIWLSWQTLSSVQLSELKELYGLSELDITFIDKMAIALTILSGTATCRAVEAVSGSPTLPLGVVESLLPMAFCALSITASFSLAQLVSARQEDTFRGRVAQEAGEREDRLFEGLTSTYGLSPREHEVFVLLAQGHTSAFIAEAAGITPGTAKAHVAHIYQKLGVHSKDEMLELVERHAQGGA